MAVVLPVRTARADNPGTALSFISHTELNLLSEVEEALTAGNKDFYLVLEMLFAACLFICFSRGKLDI